MLAKDRFDRTHGGSHQAKIVAQEDSMCLHGILRAAIYKKGKIVLPFGTQTMRIMLRILTLILSERPKLISAGDDTEAFPRQTACQYPKTPIQLFESVVEQDFLSRFV